jgi:hypothetical protein
MCRREAAIHQNLFATFEPVAALGQRSWHGAARVLGRTVAGMSYGVYSSGPGLKRLRDVIELVKF